MTTSPSIYTKTVCTFGVILTIYALYVEYMTHGVDLDNQKEGEEFQALCDIEAIGASCSAVFNLPEGRLLSYFSIVPKDHFLDVPNAFLGFLYYNVILIIEQFIYHTPKYNPTIKYVTFTFNFLAMCSSIYLACKLIVIRELCILCWTTHLLNSLLIFHYGKRLFTSKKDKVE
jgi:uncharacterized membrane protein